jgi:hypothetical protein
MDTKPNHPHPQEEDQYLDIHQAAEILEVSEEELRQLAQRHQVPTHTVGGVFLRFKKADIDTLEIKWRIERELFPDEKSLHEHKGLVRQETAFEKISDFWYFNDFYIFCSLALFVLVYFIITQ